MSLLGLRFSLPGLYAKNNLYVVSGSVYVFGGGGDGAWKVINLPRQRLIRWNIPGILCVRHEW